MQRLTHLGRLFGVVRYLHPYLAYRNIDWDGAVRKAIDAVNKADSTKAYVNAVKEMLAVLGDPQTRVEEDHPPAVSAPAPVTTHEVNDGILVVDLGAASDMDSFRAFRILAPKIAAAPAVIFDMRHVAEDNWVPYGFPYVRGALVNQPTELPAATAPFHSGYQPQHGSTSGGYFSAFVTRDAELVQPAAKTAPKRAVFVLGEHSPLPAIAVALQAQGRGVIVAPGMQVDDSGLVATTSVDLGEGWRATVRTSQAIWHGAPLSLRPDIVVAEGKSGKEDAAMRAAMRAASGKSRPRKDSKPGATPVAHWRPDETYADAAFPDRSLRVLAAYRLWNVIDLFYPYLHLIGDWDAVLPRAITELSGAGSKEEYQMAVARVAARISDSHTTVIADHDVFLRGVPPLEAEIVEGQPVVTDPGVEGKKAGAVAGDIIEAIDGVSFADAVAHVRPRVTALTPDALAARLLSATLEAPEGSSVRLRLRGADGSSREVSIVRRKSSDADADGKPPYRLLEPELGYVDLRALQVAQVDAMFEALKRTRAIIFDMRGYPKGTAWSIAPRLNRHPFPTVAATFQRRLLSGLEPDDRTSRYLFTQPLPKSNEWKYTGKTFMLINQSTISQAEHTGLFFEAANGTEFIGTPSSGANGDVTNTCLPGGIYIFFTGHDVRHADGRQLQRVGLQPDLRVAPTIAGIRAGKDEVLDAAVRYAKKKAGIR